MILHYMCEWSKIRWLKTEQKPAEHIKRISFISHAGCTSPVTRRKKGSTAPPDSQLDFFQPPQWWPIIFQREKVTWWKVTGHLVYGCKFFMLACVFIKGAKRCRGGCDIPHNSLKMFTYIILGQSKQWWRRKCVLFIPENPELRQENEI